jgi:uncharacterized repeat protein (TIGR03803 family)
MKTKSARAPLLWMLVLVMSLFVGNAHAVSKYQILHHFLGEPAEKPSSGLVADSAGNLYGVADSAPGSCGKTVGCGVVFMLTRGSDGKWSYSIIHIFKGWDGSQPSGSLILDSSGNLYGATFYGGANGAGAVFELSPSGGEWQEKVLYSFGNSSGDLQNPGGPLTFDTNGNLYGPAVNGVYNDGGIFELKPSGGTWTEVTLHTFTGSDGHAPFNVVIDSAGNLYGATVAGGQYNDGVVFELTPNGGSWTETVLHDFTGGADGALPQGVIFDSAGNLYGTAEWGGDSNCNPPNGCGMVFKLTASMGNWTLSKLHEFGGVNGAFPQGNLILDSSGTIYGTTLIGGKYNYGVVFKLSKSGSGWIEAVLHSLAGIGANPNPGLVRDQKDVLYGTTSNVSNRGDGIVFSLAP